MAKLGIKFDGSGLADLPDRVLAALAEGRFSLETETEPVTESGDFVVLRVVARRLVIDLDPSVPPTDGS